jgi:peptidoglycan/LPS O-acetylase OafA/YrhL
MIAQNAPVAQFWSLLAALRFFFAMWVLFDHTYNFGPPERAMPVLSKSGLMAVMCFFVISGFSIHHTITVTRRGYGRRRFWRIFPMNALAVGIGWFAWSVLNLSGGYGTPQVAPRAWDFIGCLLFLEIIFPVMIEFLYPAWSLSVEVLYYTFAPLLMRYRGQLLIVLIMLSSCGFFIAWPFIRDEYIAAQFSYPIPALAMLWAWLAGWVAYSHPRHSLYLAALIAGGLAGIYTQAKFFAIEDITSGAATCVAWIATLGVVFYRCNAIDNERCNAVFSYLGDISYPLYLLHYPILFALTSSILKTHPEWNYGIVQVGISLAAAIVAYQYIDKPLRNATWHFSHQRRGSEVTSRGVDHSLDQSWQDQ